MQENTQNFSYSAQPHAAPMRQKPKYREEENNEPQNIMYDARVIRGNTYSAKVLSGTPNQTVTPGTRKSRNNTTQRKGTYTSNRRAATPPPVDGRQHMVIQTEDYLEELTDRPIEQDAETQTLPFMNRPASPLFVRAKIGFDASTQIEENDLFDFDIEVEPILEVLVGKTLHISMLEVLQEEELEAIRLQQEEYENIRNIEIIELQRLEVELKRKENEKLKRLEQEKKRLKKQQDLELLIASRQYTSQFLNDLHINVFDSLQQEGLFYDPVQRDIEEIFMANLIEQVTSSVDNYEAASVLANELLENARKMAINFERQCIVKRKEYKAQLEKEERERKEQEERERQEAIEAAKKAAEEAENEEENPEED